jgi:hypothetical protein
VIRILDRAQHSPTPCRLGAQARPNSPSEKCTVGIPKAKKDAPPLPSRFNYNFHCRSSTRYR